MYTRNQALTVIAILLLIGGCYHTVFANSVHIYGGTFDLPIPANPEDTQGWMDDAIIEVPDHFNILDIDVAINVSHTKVFDLQIFLRSPAETELCLNMYNSDEFFHGENYTDTVFDDEALVPIEEGTAPFTGRFRPKALSSDNLLQVFDGQNTYGTWRLRICDMWPADTGTLDSCELIITVPEPATVLLLALGTGLMSLLKRHKHP